MTAVESNDIYSGYNDYSTAYSASEIDQDDYLRDALRTSYGARAIVSFQKS